jgi:uncharacterized protein (TIGR02231 family)
MLLPLPSQSQENAATVVSSAISSVTIFLRGAEVQREGSVALKAGAQKLVFDNLPVGLNPHSIQAAGAGSFTILGVSHSVNHLAPAAQSKETEALEGQLKALRQNISLQKAQLVNITAEDDMLKKNAAIGGSQTGVNVDKLKEFADFYRARLDALAAQKVELTATIAELEEDVQKLQKQLNELQSAPNKPTSAITVEVTAAADCQAKISVLYLVNEASWTPSYDLRATDVSSPVELTYKANVRQATGEEWSHIKPTLSTANPTLSSEKPTLLPWYIAFERPELPRSPRASEYNAMPLMMVKEVSIKDEEMHKRYKARASDSVPPPPPASSADFTTVSENQTSAEFAIDVPYTIPSDGKSHVVELAKYSLPATFEYYAVRKVERDVFLLARVTGWESLNLLSGEANIYFEERYVGESRIDTRQTDDTLSLSLGRDRNITVTRIRKKDFTAKQLFGSSVTDTREWDLTVHSKKKSPITVVVEDQIPISTNKELKVEAQQLSGATLDAATGKLTWKLTLAPAESRSMNVKYTVKYPKEKRVVLE